MSVYSNPPPFLRPRWMLLGFALTLALAAFKSHRLAHTGFHDNFVRFPPIASPETRYYPALEEYLGIVRANCAPDQVLVLVGGNSIMYGVGQPEADVWTKALQEELGPDYCVLNFALRGGSAADGATIVSEVLRDEYPRQVLVANVSPMQAADSIGAHESFRYLIKNAWDRGLLEKHPPREERFKQFWPGNAYSLDKAYNLLDGVLRFRTFGNFVSWHHFSSVPNRMYPLPISMRPRGSFPDPEPDIGATPVETRYRPEALDIEMQITRGFSVLLLNKDEQGQWAPAQKQAEDFAVYAEALRPPELRKNTLILTSSNSPYYLDRLTEDERKRDAIARELSVEMWRKAGYQAFAYAEGFDETDFADRTHLATSGGRKLAKLVGAKIKDMTKDIRYE